LKHRHLTIICILSLFAAAGATTILELGIEDLVERSDKIVQAEVSAIVTRWDKDSAIIETFVRLNVIDDMTGDEEGEEIIIAQPGGMIGTVTLTVEGTPSYVVGENVILFLCQDVLNRTVYRTTGMYQGKYGVYADAESVMRLSRDSSDASLVAIEGRDPSETLETGNGYTVDDFKAVVLEKLEQLGL
jgi:hypothetical protein